MKRLTPTGIFSHLQNDWLHAHGLAFVARPGQPEKNHVGPGFAFWTMREAKDKETQTAS